MPEALGVSKLMDIASWIKACSTLMFSLALTYIKLQLLLLANSLPSSTVISLLCERSHLFPTIIFGNASPECSLICASQSLTF